MIVDCGVDGGDVVVDAGIVFGSGVDDVVVDGVVLVWFR